MRLLKLILILCLCLRIYSYRLNVPRVLLPYHPKNQVQYQLEVSHPEGGCFNWRSTRPGVVTVEPINPSSRGCSDKAIITSKSKHPEEQTAVIFAEEPASGVTLSCGVTVDVMKSIEITTTTKVLFVDAAPARMIVEAFNKEGDRFSSLGDIPFDWHFTFGEGRPLRIVPFGQSKYDAPSGIEELEREKKKGFVVLVEGIHTGDAQLTAKFLDSEFANIEGNSIELLVIANVLLVPSNDLYVPLHSVIQYGAVIVKQDSTQPISLPSAEYSLQLSNTSICSLDQKTSKVYAMALGTTEITLIDSNMKTKHGLKPQSSRISVVEPDAIQFSIDRGGLWYLQKGLDYRINVKLTDMLGNIMFIPDNAKFETQIPTAYFEVLESSKNGTYFYVKAKKSGKTILKSKFVSIFDQRGYEQKIKTSVDGEQELQISDPITVDPPQLVFPYHQKERYQYPLKAFGGTGLYQWSSSDRSIAMVEESRGIVHSGELGETFVEVNDVYNPAHTAQSKVLVIEPTQVHFGPTPVEAEIGTELVVNVQLMGRDSRGNLVPFTDCRHVNFRYAVDDLSIFTVNTAAQQRIPEENRGCTTVTLKAVSSGDTKVKVWFGSQTAVLDISAYPSLKLTAASDLLMMLGAGKSVSFEGGPRPWLLDSSGYFNDIKSNDNKQTSVNLQGNSFNVYCSENSGEATVVVAVGNKKSTTNSLPAVARSKIRICCSVPTRLSLTTKPKSSQNLPPCPAFAHSIHFNIPSLLELSGFGKCSNDQEAEERIFDSISSLNVDFTTVQKKLLNIESIPVEATEPSKIPSRAVPKGLPGTVDIDAKTHDFFTLGNTQLKKQHKIPTGELSTRLSLNLVDFAKADPDTIVLWNEKNVRGKVIVSGGSGHFWFDNDEIRQVVQATLHSHPKDSIAHIELAPITQGLTKLTLYDLCIDGNKLQIGIKVTDINRINIKATDMVELGTQIPLKIFVLDVESQPFPLEDVKLMNLALSSSSEFVKLQKTDLLNYDVRGLKVGTSVITASARSSTGKIIKSAPHQIQVFEPLSLEPRVVTLIPESVFQLQILGGPESLPSLKFSLNNTAVATVSDNGLITSTTTLGYSSITAAVTNRGVPITKDTVVLKVVSMTGVKILVTTTTVQEGEIVFARVQGVADDETPFSFGGAEYPLNVTWKLSAEDVLNFTSPLTELVEEPIPNRFGVQLLANRGGRVTLHATVTVHPKSKKHFQSKATEFSDSIQITVEPSLKLTHPEILPKSILMTTDTSLDLSANRPQKNVVYSTELNKTPLIWLTGENKETLQSGNQEGNAALKISYISTAHNETTVVPVEIIPVNSIHLSADLPALSISTRNLEFLPEGIWIRLVVTFRDGRGRPFHATNTQLRYRPHRFDLTEIIAGDSNRTFSVHLKYAGETVFKVWDASDPRKSAFIRLPVAELPPSEDVENVTETAIKECAKPETKKIFVVDQDRAITSHEYFEFETKPTKPTGFFDSLANFFDKYQQLILALLVVCLSAILLFSGFRLGLLTANQTRPPTYMSPIQQDGMEGSFGYWRTLSKPLVTSTPIEPITRTPGRKSPRKNIEEQSSLNFSGRSSGSSGEPFLWSTQDSFKAGSPTVVNRLYRS